MDVQYVNERAYREHKEEISRSNRHAESRKRDVREQREVREIRDVKEVRDVREIHYSGREGDKHRRDRCVIVQNIPTFY